MTLFGVNITWTAVVAAMVAVVGVACAKNYAGAYINKGRAQAESVKLEKRMKSASSKGRLSCSQQAAAIKQFSDQYVDEMNELTFMAKLLGQYDDYGKYRQGLR